MMARGSSTSITDTELNEAEFATSEPARELVFLTSDADGRAKGAKKLFQTVIQLLFTYGIPVMCVVLAISGRFRVPFIIGAILGTQFAYIQFRRKRFSGPLIDDAATRARVSAPLIELCTAARRAAPQVQVKRTSMPAAIIRVGGHVTLQLSPDFLDGADDSEVRAVLSHEVAHLRRDVPTKKKQRVWPPFVITVVSWGYLFAVGAERVNWTYFALFLAFLVPGLFVISFVVGSTRRKRETRADLEGAAAIGDPDAMIRGLTVVYSLVPEIRRRIFGPKALRWMLFPYSLPLRTHPPLAERVAALRAMSLHDTMAKAKLPAANVSRAKFFRALLGAAIGVSLLFILHHDQSPGNSTKVVEPGGSILNRSVTHFVSLADLDLRNVAPGFTPLPPARTTALTITANEAISMADVQLGITQHDDVTVNLTEADFNVRNFNIDFGRDSALGRTSEIPVFLVMYSGPYVTNLDEPNVTEILEIVTATGSPVAHTIYLDGP
jgi:Zn-dependent protease with chaperone function